MPGRWGELTVPQYLAELVCIRYAKAIHKEELAKGYWNKPKYQRFHQLQIIQANSLLNLYHYKDVLTALNTRGSWICTLRRPELDDFIKEAQEKRLRNERLAEEKKGLDAENTNGKSPPPIDNSPPPPTIPVADFYDTIKNSGRQTNKKSLKGRLDG
jgi:hypothetical protein